MQQSEKGAPSEEKNLPAQAYYQRHIPSHRYPINRMSIERESVKW